MIIIVHMVNKIMNIKMIMINITTMILKITQITMTTCSHIRGGVGSS